MSLIEAAPSSAITLCAACLHPRLVHLGGHEGADDGDFLALARRQFRAVARVKGGGGFLALLDHLGQQGKDFVVAQKIAAGFGARGDVAVLQRRQHQAQGGQALGVLGLHRLFHRVVELLRAAPWFRCLLGKRRNLREIGG